MQRNIRQIVLQSVWQLATIVTIKMHKIFRFVTHIAYLVIGYVNVKTFLECFKFDSPNILIFAIVHMYYYEHYMNHVKYNSTENKVEMKCKM